MKWANTSTLGGYHSRVCEDELLTTGETVQAGVGRRRARAAGSVGRSGSGLWGPSAARRPLSPAFLAARMWVVTEAPDPAVLGGEFVIVAVDVAARRLRRRASHDPLQL